MMVIEASPKKSDNRKERVTAVPITPVVLLWARKKAGFTLEQAAKRAKIGRIKSPVPKLPAERLEEWEKGVGGPTAPQLDDIAKAYRRPVITFFLPTPPCESDLLTDFRTIGDHVIENASPEFMALRRKIEAMFHTLREIELQENTAPLSFVGSFRIGNDKDKLIADIRRRLNFQFETQLKIPSTTDIFKVLRERLHNIGVYVLRVGDLGSHHSQIDPTEFRGISIADPLAPIIVINSNDAETAQTFTLVHEMVHIWLGESGVSNVGFENIQIESVYHTKLERFCNAVAGEFLVPHVKLLEFIENNYPFNTSDSMKQVEILAGHFKVSKLVAAKRLLDIGRVSEQGYWDLYNALKKQWLDLKKKLKQERGSTPISRKNLDKRRLGQKLIHRFLAATRDGLLSSQEVSRLINVPVFRFKELE